MIYLSGHVHRSLHYLEDFGFMLQPQMGNRIPCDQVWAADTGCFRNPKTFNERAYLRWLAKHNPETCLFATAPDVPYDMLATLAAARPVLSKIREAGYAVALVAQDGAEALALPWDEFDTLFIGGTTEWKLGRAAYLLCAEALAHDKWLHMGRVNGWPRGLRALVRGCHSVDGTILAWGRDVNLPIVKEWMRWLNRQQSFFSVAG